ncbi:MAG: hypothetical protein K6E83_11285 [Clostridium sp.]|nr:hypothetical protein [Clostridium sp.]
MNRIGRKAVIIAAAAISLTLASCGTAKADEAAAGPAMTESETVAESRETAESQTVAESQETAQNQNTEESRGVMAMQMKTGETPVTVQWEDNDSVRALGDLCSEQPVTIQMSMYGGFEQVGPIGERLPASDVQTKTEAGDIVLYSGNQLVVFYGSNSWAYTRLGHITDRDAAGMSELLSGGDVVITISVEEKN